MKCELLTDYLLEAGRKAPNYFIKIELVYNYLKPIKWGYLRSHEHETIVDTDQHNNYNYLKKWS
jgi:hypothetical protein